ncbi:MAG: APC family permease [Candidatus Eisenbacteria bacterium]|nr:APC family permease [Candidatus Eisenbacteria bacterium]
MNLHWIVLPLLNVAILVLFVKLLLTKNLLVYFKGGRWWLTWFSVAIITLMDELTSVFYAPSEAWRFIGENAIIYIALTSIFMHFSTTRMVEVAQILEKNNIKGGGVYSFSYLALGPTMSFIAVASIMVAYILTASISTVSAVGNGMSFLPLSFPLKIGLQLAIIWGIAGLNILGIKENARLTFSIFMGAAVVFLNLIAAGFLKVDQSNLSAIAASSRQVWGGLTAGVLPGFHSLIVGISMCILAYSGIESVVQTAGLVKNWKEVARAYIFLAVTVGIVTPVVAMLALSSKIDFAAHEGDLITHYATMLGGPFFGIVVGLLASITLIMAVNTAYVASSELIERVADRYNFRWIIKPNSRQSLYRIHIANGFLYTAIIFITSGSQKTLAEMYALGLLASFCINMGSLLIYRYFRGTKQIQEYNTSRFGTLIIFIIFLSCFIYLAVHKTHGTIMWASATVIALAVGFAVARKRAPEIKEIRKTDSPMDMIFYMAEAAEETVHVYFKRPKEEADVKAEPAAAFVSFYSPREGIPPKFGDNHFRFPLQAQNVQNRMLAMLELVRYELPHKRVVVHLGWPLSSWLDRMAVGVMVYGLMKLPKMFPEFSFVIEHFPPAKKPGP